QGEPFLLDSGTLATEAKVEFRLLLDPGQADEGLVRPRAQRRLEAVGIRAEDDRPVAAEHLLAVQPDRLQARAGCRELDLCFFRDGDFAAAEPGVLFRPRTKLGPRVQP